MRSAFRFGFALLVAFGLPARADQMTAHFINTGQAAATLLEFPCGAILVDAGSQDDAATTALTDYLDAFFARRTDLQGTLNSVIITHPHIDHTEALKEVARKFKVINFVDNGQQQGSGWPQIQWLRKHDEPATATITCDDVLDSEILALPTRTGLTSTVLDPLDCTGSDRPRIRFFSGQAMADPGWPSGEFGDENNHSLVFRVDYGMSSFLFTGDLEEPAIETLVDYYRGTSLLDTDVWLVGHHGSYNGATQSLMDAVTPKITVIEVGKWSFGRNPPQTFSTYAYGHPRLDTIDLLKDNISRRRQPGIKPYVATAAKKFKQVRIKKAIYATAWDGNIVISADADGSLVVRREQ